MLAIVLGRNYQFSKKLKKEKKRTYSRVFKNTAIEKPNVWEHSPKMVYSRVLKNATQTRSIATFLTKHSYRSHLIRGWENAAIGCKNAAIGGPLAAFIKMRLLSRTIGLI